ncbi:DeoR/GlpR family DNA-binding transcription regulator [Jeotgalibacillus soli]|uniref:HTH deoR-type domain-containing protein n=1 Tax=Jeotgalibacillus soli TaxID=889306 RepID=A0A0C2SDU2_9BACL|nr:DeoR/GlpR family DNA-binding transcription regulator [Jeotgalibacillus soli]KIL52119.1 hypothetical protein KP78_04890 [Jeotgalibacillus soli]
MLFVQRHEKIIEQLNKEKSIKVSDLSMRFDVTEKTIRSDLELLEKRGLLKRIHGGAILPEEKESILPIESRQKGHSEEKLLIAKKALQLISPEDTIFLDGGSTTLALADLLGATPVTVITNDLKIAVNLLPKENVQLMVPGGVSIGTSGSLIGPIATETLEKIRVNRLFLGTTGMDAKYGLTVFNSLHSQWKKQIIESAQTVTLVVDHSKIGKVALIKFADFSMIDELITDKRLDKEMKAIIKQNKIKVIGDEFE